MNLSQNQLNKPSNVVGIFSKEYQASLQPKRIIRLSAELDNWQMLYHNNHEDRMYTLPILCWALLEDGHICGMVPWLTHLESCEEIKLSSGGEWMGYYQPETQIHLETPPKHKLAELNTFNDAPNFCDSDIVVQEIPDLTGTHAIFAGDASDEICLVEVFSWQLMEDGHVRGMIIDCDLVDHTPVLPGDNSLTSAQSDNAFIYYFHNGIASKIKSQDPEALAAIAILTDQLNLD